jgi:hypothetical protein
VSIQALLLYAGSELDNRKHTDYCGEMLPGEKAGTVEARSGRQNTAGIGASS